VSETVYGSYTDAKPRETVPKRGRPGSSPRPADCERPDCVSRAARARDEAPRRPLTSDELRKLVGSLVPDEAGAARCAHQADDGDAPREVLALRISDLDPATRRLTIARRLRTALSRSRSRAGPRAAAGLLPGPDGVPLQRPLRGQWREGGERQGQLL